jgi:hypothetical protein
VGGGRGLVVRVVAHEANAAPGQGGRPTKGVDAWDWGG